jgi:hypothetical protein
MPAKIKSAAVVGRTEFFRNQPFMNHKRALHVTAKSSVIARYSSTWAPVSGKSYHNRQTVRVDRTRNGRRDQGDDDARQ